MGTVQIEYLISQEYTRKVLTDESSFSFERGMEEVSSSPKINLSEAVS